MAVDGSDLHIPHNPRDTETYFQSTPGTKGFNLLHVNALYDLLNRVYLDGEIQPGRKKHERQALIEMMRKSDLDSPVLLVADRGYESYNVFAHMMAKGWKFLIRVKDASTRSMLGTFNTPASGEFDQIVHRELTRKQTKQIRQNPDCYKFLPTSVTFDFLDEYTHIGRWLISMLYHKSGGRRLSLRSHQIPILSTLGHRNFIPRTEAYLGIDTSSFEKERKHCTRNLCKNDDVQFLFHHYLARSDPEREPEI